MIQVNWILLSNEGRRGERGTDDEGTQVGRDSGWGHSLGRGRPSLLSRGAVISAPTLPPWVPGKDRETKLVSRAK